MRDKSMLMTKQNILLVGLISGVVGVAAISYQIGTTKHRTQAADEPASSQQKTNRSPEMVLAEDVRKMETRLNVITANLEKLTQRSSQANKELEQVQYADPAVLSEVRIQIDSLPDSPQQRAVPLPEGSTSARVAALPKSQSGIPQPVLDNYQRETGVNSAEVESLMQRTQ